MDDPDSENEGKIESTSNFAEDHPNFDLFYDIPTPPPVSHISPYTILSQEQKEIISSQVHDYFNKLVENTRATLDNASGSTSLPSNLKLMETELDLVHAESDDLIQISESWANGRTGNQGASNDGIRENAVREVGEGYSTQSEQWVRPPLIGQAAASENPGTSSSVHHDASLEEIQAGQGLEPPFPPTEGDSQRDESLLEHQEGFSDHGERVGRVPSPASNSSVTSNRRLEWDSGADVGYSYARRDNSSTTGNVRLSTIERIALARGCSAALRSDPEGTTEPGSRAAPGRSRPAIPSPVAESTRVERSNATSSAESDTEITPILRQPVVRTFPGFEPASDKCIPEEPEPRKLSSSLTDLNAAAAPGHDLRRSQSHLSLAQELGQPEVKTLLTSRPHLLPRAGSGSTSSVATVVPNKVSPRMSDKHVQTTIHRHNMHSIGIQTNNRNSTSLGQKNPVFSLQSSLKVTKESQVSLESGKNAIAKDNNFGDKCFKKNSSTYRINGKVIESLSHATKSLSLDKEQKGKRILGEDNRTDSMPVGGVSRQEPSSCGSRLRYGEGGTLDSVVSSRRDSLMAVGSANSFEYLPGHVYDPSPGQSGSTSRSGSSLSLNRDLEKNIQLMRNLVERKSCDPEARKRLVRLIVDRLVNTEYKEDEGRKERTPQPGPDGTSSSSSTIGSGPLHPFLQQICSRVVDKCVGTGASETSGRSSGRVGNSTDGYRVSATSSSSTGPAWLRPASRSEAEFELRRSRRDTGDAERDEATLLKACEAERENQLSWILAEIQHLTDLKQLLERQEKARKSKNQPPPSGSKREVPSSVPDMRTQWPGKRQTSSSSSEPGRPVAEPFYKRGRVLNRPDDTLDSRTNDGRINVRSYRWQSTELPPCCCRTEKGLREVLREASGKSSEQLCNKCRGRIEEERAASKQSNDRQEAEVPKERTRAERSPVAYQITFQRKGSRKQPGSTENSTEHSEPESDGKPTLQGYLMQNRPDFVTTAEARRRCLDELAYLREVRHGTKLRLLGMASAATPDSGMSSDTGVMAALLQHLPPPPLAVKRVFSQKTMRRQTERKYKHLPEVENKKAEKKKQAQYRSNRLMADIFNRKLQRKTLKGQVNLSNSVSVISYK